MRPVTSACALMARQSGNFGTASTLAMRSMKACVSTGANRPLRLRLLVITPVTPRATSLSAGEPPTKSGSAIGIGATLPCVMSTRGAANASRECGAISAPAPSAAPVSNRPRRVSRSAAARSAEHLSRIEGKFNLFPHVISGDRQSVRLTLDNRADRALGGNLEHRIAVAVHQDRLALQRSVLIEIDPDRDDQALGVGKTGRRSPALRHLVAQHVHLVLRQRRGVAHRAAERLLVVKLLARDALATRVALVEQRRRLDRIEFRRRLGRRRLLDRRRLGLLLRRLR